MYLHVIYYCICLCNRLLTVNIPTVSFGLAMGWVSLVSGEAPAEEAEASGRGAVIAAVTTFGASMAGVPLSARALLYGRKFALIGTSACFAVGMMYTYYCVECECMTVLL